MDLLSLDKKQQAALLEAISLLSAIFWGPDSESIRLISQNVYLNPFETLVPSVKFSPAIIAELKSFPARFPDSETLFQHLEGVYVSRFINSPGGVIAPLYASCYEGEAETGSKRPLMGPPALNMKKRYESKGLSLGRHIHEPPDHLSIELEYLYFLLHNGWAGQDRNLLSEAVQFVKSDMLPWVTPFRERLAADKQGRFYLLVASLALSILQWLGRFYQAGETRATRRS